MVPNQLVKVEPGESANYFHLFNDFPVFRNYLNYAFEFLTPEIWVDSPEAPAAAVMYTMPAYFFSGDPEAVDAPGFFEQMPPNSWMLAASPDWEQAIEDFFGERLEVHLRTHFSNASLSPAHLDSLKKPLPDQLELVQIGEKELALQESILQRSVLQEYFAGADFLERGLGFCIMDGETMAAYAAANFPMRDDILEVYIRTADAPQYRQQGLGMAVSIALLEHCLENGIDPEWDAANQVSAYIAEKLGYTVDKNWKMYHLKSTE